MKVPRRRLGRTGLSVPLLGLGSGGPSRLGQARGADVESVRLLVETALDLGIDFFDTAPAYGESERLLGEALRDVPRENYTLCTKFHPLDASKAVRPADDLVASIEQSLDRLETSYFDVFYLHSVPPDAWATSWEVFAAGLAAAKRDGLIRHIGVSEAYVDDHHHDTVRFALDVEEVDVVMVGYNLLSPSAQESILPVAAERDKGVVIMCASRKVISDPDLLEGVIRNWKRRGWLSDDQISTTRPLDWLLDEAASVTAAAYRFAAQRPEVGCVLTGTSSVEHLKENAAAIVGPPLSDETLERMWTTFGPVRRNVSPRDALE